MTHTPEDMTVTVAADVRLADLQVALAKARQWLPIDPPDPSATLAAILNANASGPRRFGCGTVRDYVIGLKVRLADGRIVKSGGQVVKNVAGYDLQKLFIGSNGMLATPIEVTFKLRPLPESERFIQKQFTTLAAAGAAVEAVVASELAPVVFDLHHRPGAPFALVLGFAGPTEDVDWQLALAAQLGFEGATNLDYDPAFHMGAIPPQKLSVLPSKLVETLRAFGDAPFVARAGNGIIYHRTNIAAPAVNPPVHLFRRMKDAFDPNRLLPELPA